MTARAGCVGDGDCVPGVDHPDPDAIATRTPTDTPMAPAEAATEPPQVPRITRATLVWSARYDDFVQRDVVESVAPGPGGKVGIAVLLPIDPGGIASGSLRS